tara:strand:+ start:313 stop:528 length:216 start_codon:yes stop_codon:yes gene_type:complete
MEDRLRTAETNIEVLKTKTKVSQNRISDLERGYEKLSDKVDVISGNMNKWMGVLLLSVFISPFLFNIWMSS